MICDSFTRWQHWSAISPLPNLGLVRHLHATFVTDELKFIYLQTEVAAAAAGRLKTGPKYCVFWYKMCSRKWRVCSMNLPYMCCSIFSNDSNTKMHQIRFRMRLRFRPRWGNLQRSLRPCSWIWRGLLLTGGRENKGKGGEEREVEGTWVEGRKTPL